ncbi:regulator of chromosome condensation 1/beta-lactamase-inhibitor protein II [Phycomyces nitens]|nr:regulator of chromosome condensation 1/beta-lactamase-inhibitor protein II [Phycomyces nitens]
MPLYAFGSNGNGQLGVGHCKDLQVPEECRGIPPNDTVIKVVGGGNHSAVLLESGRVLLSGLGQQGEAKQKEFDRDQSGVIEPQWICYHEPDVFSRHVWRDVACGWSFTLLVSIQGHVYGYGTAKYGELEKSGSFNDLLRIGNMQDIVKVDCGWRHAIALDSQGSVYGWGWGRHGQIGRLENIKDIALPQKMTTNEPVIQIACGHIHTLLLGKSGSVYGLGSNKYGQIGDESKGKHSVVSISAGWHHSASVDCQGRLAMWGRNNHSQLRDLSGVLQVSCGSEHTLAIQDGQVLAWGWNEHGNCGSDKDIVSEPSTIQLSAILIGTGCAASWVVTL